MFLKLLLIHCGQMHRPLNFFTKNTFQVINIDVQGNYILNIILVKHDKENNTLFFFFLKRLLFVGLHFILNLGSVDMKYFRDLETDHHITDNSSTPCKLELMIRIMDQGFQERKMGFGPGFCNVIQIRVFDRQSKSFFFNNKVGKSILFYFLTSLSLNIQRRIIGTLIISGQDGSGFFSSRNQIHLQLFLPPF